MRKGIRWFWVQDVARCHLKWREMKIAQLCLTLCNPMDYIVHGILQATILECIAGPFFRGSSQPRDWTQVSHILGGFFRSWATRETQTVAEAGVNEEANQSSCFQPREGTRVFERIGWSAARFAWRGLCDLGRPPGIMEVSLASNPASSKPLSMASSPPPCTSVCFKEENPIAF